MRYQLVYSYRTLRKYSCFKTTYHIRLSITNIRL
nr:MAG TPA: hypothetical protein [Caudoviricetes sp.]